MKILLFGIHGQLGWALYRALTSLGDVEAYSREELNFQDLESLSDCVRHSSADCIINAVGYTHVDQAEKDPTQAYRINVEAVKVLAQEARLLNAWLIHYSTNYVFDGTQSSTYKETDTISPIGVYGKTKYEGEQVVYESGCKHIIFRVNYLYSLLPRFSNLFFKIFSRLKNNDTIRMVNDQFCTPTSVDLIADVTALCLYSITTCMKESVSGVYHLSALGSVSWHELALYIHEQARLYNIALKVSEEQVYSTSSREYLMFPQRPKAVILDSMKCMRTFGITLPHWKVHFQRIIQEYAMQQVHWRVTD